MSILLWTSENVVTYYNYAVDFVEWNFILNQTKQPISNSYCIKNVYSYSLAVSDGFTLTQQDFVQRQRLTVRAVGECIKQAPAKVSMILEEAKNLCQTCILD